MTKRSKTFMAYKMPPLNGIRAVEAVGRHGSITGAADELCVTPGAVSRHVAIVEEYFGRRLFIRERSGTVLTEIGRQYVEQVTAAFQQLNSASANSMRKRENKTLKIRMLGVIASEWMMHIMPEFEAMHPSINTEIIADHKLVNFNTDVAHVGIIAGNGDWKNLESVKLFTPHFTPISSADYVKDKTFDSAEALSECRVLHPMDIRPNWDEWLSAVFPGQYVNLTKSCWFENSSQMYSVIKRGYGIGLGNCLMVEEDLLNGSLVAPIKKIVPAPASVYLAWPKQQNDMSPIVEEFKNWICERMEATKTRLNPVFSQMERLPLNLTLNDLFDN